MLIFCLSWKYARFSSRRVDYAHDRSLSIAVVWPRFGVFERRSCSNTPNLEFLTANPRPDILMQIDLVYNYYHVIHKN